MTIDVQHDLVALMACKRVHTVVTVAHDSDAQRNVLRLQQSQEQANENFDSCVQDYCLLSNDFQEVRKLFNPLL